MQPKKSKLTEGWKSNLESLNAKQKETIFFLLSHSMNFWTYRQTESLH